MSQLQSKEVRLVVQTGDFLLLNLEVKGKYFSHTAVCCMWITTRMLLRFLKMSYMFHV